MTEDTTPENLRKFLESDDPAMVLMGLSMAKGSGVPEELLPTILKLYMWDDDKTVRAAAKSVFNKHAPAEIQAKVKENWKASYRTLSITGNRFQEAVRPFVQAFKSQNDFAEIALEPHIKALRHHHQHVRWTAAKTLGKIGKPAVEPLIAALGDEDSAVHEVVAEVLGEIGDARAVEPLIKALGDDNEAVRANAACALGQIGDVQAVESLIKALRDDNEAVRQYAVHWLGKIGDARAVEPLIKVLENDEDEWVRGGAKEALKKLGHKVK